jgi:type II secretory pathway predicted ATPase ExeA
MFLDFFGLREQPFGVTPDPRFLYLGASHREALASLFYGIKTGRGILALVAQPGMGKTTLLFRFLEHLRRSARTAFLFQTQCDSSGLLRYFLADLGIDAHGQDFVGMHEQLNELLLRESSAGRRVVLVIDEAQNLDDHVLETARLLSDFETPSEKLLQIVLVGQSQLAEKLERPELAQLRQRIDILARLEPFSAGEVATYIDHRLRVAGYSGGRLFRPEAVDRIVKGSRGIPRNINNLCFNALSLGCAYGRKQIDADLVREASADLDLGPLANQRRLEPLPVVRSVRAVLTAPDPVPGTRVPIIRWPERDLNLGRVAVFAACLVLGLLVAVWDRNDIKIAAAETRRTIAAAAASLSSHPSLVRTDPTGTTGITEQDPAAPAQTELDGSAATPASSSTNSDDTSLSSPPLSPALAEQAGEPAIPRMEQTSSRQVELNGETATVIVQPHDDLRKICLQYLGAYSARLLNKISKLNPELTDPDHLEIGQRIVLPRSPEDKPHDFTSSPGPTL